jgi:hypothetical protein
MRIQTLFVNDIQRTVDDIMKFESVVPIREALQVERIILQTTSKKQTKDLVYGILLRVTSCRTEGN